MMILVLGKRFNNIGCSNYQANLQTKLLLKGKKVNLIINLIPRANNTTLP